MKINNIIQDTGSNTFLAGTILFANVDYPGLEGYAIKAAIGGAIWMAFKLAGEYLSSKLFNKKKEEDHIDKMDKD